MRRLDETPLDPEIVAALDAIDATLAGEAVDPEHAEFAELALLLADERPRPEPAFAAALDERVGRRFESSRPVRRPWRRWMWAPAAGLAACLVVAVVVVLGSGGAGSSGRALSLNAAPPQALHKAVPSSAASSTAAPPRAAASSSAAGAATPTAPQPTPHPPNTIHAAHR
jgi:hypothetical protein